MAAGYLDIMERFKLTKIHLVIAAITSIPVFWVAESYMERLHASEKEAFATALTMCFLGLVFTGRHFATVWKDSIPLPLKTQYTILGVIVAWTTLFLLIYPDFNTLHSRPG